MVDAFSVSEHSSMSVGDATDGDHEEIDLHDQACCITENLVDYSDRLLTIIHARGYQLLHQLIVARHSPAYTSLSMSMHHAISISRSVRRHSPFALTVEAKVSRLVTLLAGSSCISRIPNQNRYLDGIPLKRGVTQ